MVSTSVYALLLAVLASVFLYVPLLIADIFRTSDVVLAGLGLALSVAYYIHQGQAAPFHVLTPRTSEEVARDSLPVVTRFVGQAWKFGLLFSGFVVVGVLVYAVPVLTVLFAGEGLVAAPFLILLAGSFAIYPLITMVMDTLVGLGRLRLVLLTYAAWTIIVVLVLLVVSPIGHELVVSLMWIVGIPFLLIFSFLYQRHTQTRLNVGFLPRGLVVLAGIALVSYGILFTGSIVITTLGLVGYFAMILQVCIILTLIPLFYFYLWGLVKIRVLLTEDLQALLSISQVLHPISRPVTWLIKQLE
jgi:O-antigen/teichoic acid export membrane protein